MAFCLMGIGHHGPIAMRQLKFLIVGIDYFTKWVEVEALATIIVKNV